MIPAKSLEKLTDIQFIGAIDAARHHPSDLPPIPVLSLAKQSGLQEIVDLLVSYGAH